MRQVRHNTEVTLPERLGRLRRVDRIGAGGFATVWLYHDDDLESPVAVKALADNWAQRTDVRERFLEEARMLRRADSEHVVRVYDIGEVDQTPYFVMSYADRGSLAAVTDAGPVPPGRAVDLISQAGEGIRVLHRRGIIHRDIKPQNLLLRTGEDDTEDVLVADLGVAKAMLHASGLTQVVGTPAYMAPEQANGLGVDTRADVHALGAVAYHLMTGRTAREGGIADLAAPRRPEPPSTVRPELAPFDPVLLRALEPQPDDRWPDVQSFVSALREAAGPAQAQSIDPVPSVVGPSSSADPSTVLDDAPAVASEPHTRAPGRRRALLIGVCAAVLACVVAGALLVSRALGGDGGPAPTTSSPPPSAEPSIAADIDWPALGSNIRLTEQHRIVAPGGSMWSYAVPKGWVPSFLSAGRATTSSAGVDEQTEVQWRPGGEPDVGGFQLRFRALDPTQTPLVQRIQRLALIRHARYPGFDLYKRTDNGLWFTYVDEHHHLRYNFWRWVPDPRADGDAGLEISVSGRKRDVQGLGALIRRAVAAARPVPKEQP